MAPLDWGLGHCTRCIPIIHHLVQQGCTVLLAAEGTQASLLRLEFPTLEILPLAGYNIRYSSSKNGFAIKMLQQLPRIVRAIRKENKWLKELVEKRTIDLVISDNRYGLYHDKVKTVIITHQLRVKAPFSWVENIIQTRLYKYINKFDACWVPDAAGAPNLAGSLSHPARLPKIPVTYLGPLSRLHPLQQPQQYKLLILLSGPEPQRTILEKKMVQQLQTASFSTLLVRGLPSGAAPLRVGAKVQVANHLSATALQTAMAAASVVIARSGYSTVMDLCKLKKKAILVPTPAQTEQEYLARHLFQQRQFLYYEQSTFDLLKAVAESEIFSFRFPAIEMDGYKQVIDHLLAEILPGNNATSATFAGKTFS